MTPIIEGLTHIAAIVFYTAALIMGLIAFHRARLWARRTSTVGIMLVAAGWLIFYLAVTNLDFTEVHTSVLWSRVFHYNTATWLFIMAFVIRRSERYGVELALSRGPDE
jgi:hypothetical protein